MQKEQELKPKHVTPKETIDGWKATYGDVHKLTVRVKDKTGKLTDLAVGYIRDINEDIDVIANVLSMQNNGQIIECKVFLLENAWLGGDPRIFNTIDPSTVINSIKLGAATQAGKTVDVLEGNVEKL